MFRQLFGIRKLFRDSPTDSIRQLIRNSPTIPRTVRDSPTVSPTIRDSPNYFANYTRFANCGAIRELDQSANYLRSADYSADSPTTPQTIFAIREPFGELFRASPTI
jgi:hypothetical protein